MSEQQRHRTTGRFLAFDCEVDCQEHCAGLCGNWQNDDVRDTENER